MIRNNNAQLCVTLWYRKGYDYLKHHHLVEAHLSFYSFALAGRYNFEDGTLENIIKVYLWRGLVLEFSKIQIAETIEQ